MCVCQLIFTGGFHRVARASSPAYPSHPRPIILSKNQKHTLTGWKNNPGDKKCNGIIREKEEGPILFPSFFVVLLMTEWCDVVRLSGRFHAHFWGPVIIIPDGERERERERGWILVVNVSVSNLLSKRENGSSIFGWFLTRLFAGNGPCLMRV